MLLATIGSCVISYHIASGVLELLTGGSASEDPIRGESDSQELPLQEWNPSWADHAECSGDMPAELWDEMLELRKASDPQVGIRHVIFVRHAQGLKDSPETATTPSTASGSVKADAKAALSEVGQKQVQLTAKRLLDLFEEVDTVYHSGAPVDKATAKVLHKAFSKDPQSMPRLVETGLLSEAVPVLPSPAPAALRDGMPAEKLQAHAARAECAFHAFVWPPRCDKKHRQLASTEIVVGPGNLIRFLTCRAIQLPKQAWSRMAASHCTVTWLEIGEDGGVILREFGGSGHMPAELWTYY